VQRRKPLELTTLIILVGLLTASPALASNEFLWKPQSESDGKLVVLFPQSYREETVRSITVDGKGRVDRPTRVSQDGSNGDRIHARFGSSGASYGKNVKVTLSFKGGGDRTWTVHNGAGRFTMQGGGTGDSAPGGSSHGGGFSGLDDVLNDTGKTALIKLSHTKPGEKEFTLEEDTKLEAVVCLRTYGKASLSVTVNGKEWISWARANDADASPCQVGGKAMPKSMFEESPGDFSARDVTVPLDARKGDVIAATLEGSFGGAESCVVVRPATKAGKPKEPPARDNSASR
jgi:hypothetical protein